MVLAGKIFKLREETSLKALAAKLKGYSKEESYTEEGFKQNLITEVKDLILKSTSLEGVFSQDRVVHVPYRGELLPVPKTSEALFAFYEYKDEILLLVLEKKWQANNIANLLCEILFITTGFIVEARIPSEKLKYYHEQNIAGTKIIFFSDINIPNVNKLSLYGASLANTSLYTNFLTHGNIWYIVVTSKKHGYIVGLTGNAIVTVFNRIEPSEFLEYATDEVFPLIEKK